MKKIYSLLVLSLFVGLQCFGQRYIKLYQDDVVIKQLSTEEIDSISITETEPHIVNFWYDGKIFLNYNAAGIDSITVTNNGKQPLTYAGIVAFNSELKTKDLNILAPSTKNYYTYFIDCLTTNDGTILYYAFDNGLNMLENANIETPLESVHVITFTDGLDQGSLMLTDKYGSSVEYLNALRNRIAQTKVSGLSPQFYSVGLRGSDVSNVELFRQNLRGLASSDANAIEVYGIDEIGSKFDDIAEQIQNVSTRQSMTFKVPGVESGTRMRFVFDNQAAENSQLYIEGTLNLQDRCLHDVVYHGIKAVSGKTIQGTQDGIFLTYTFTGMHRETGTSLIPTSSVKHYYKYPSSTSWQYNSEFSGTTSSQKNVSHTGTVILLIIDCSSSLTNDNFSVIKQYAKSFLNHVAENAEPFVLEPPVEYIDLGLPSGTLWATCNVGASQPEECGDYYAWGETKPKSNYVNYTYKWGDYDGLTKYCSKSDYGLNGFTDNKTILDRTDDAAYAYRRGKWRMPTKADFDELLNNTSNQWVTNYNGTGVNGRLFTASNGNSIFLPAAGKRGGTSLSGVGSSGYYWSSSLKADRPYNAYDLYFSSSKVSVYNYWSEREDGRTVRPVRPKN